ncbi:MAG: hypothetical protein HYV07_01970 [Deltaproteobacteria bacterium]|nr:hypothetical protein [Deltaproteobacteria bacterium]
MKSASFIVLTTFACGPRSTQVTAPELPIDDVTLIAVMMNSSRIVIESQDRGAEPVLRSDEGADLSGELTVVLGVYPVSLERLRIPSGRVRVVAPSEPSRALPTPLATFAYDSEAELWQPLDEWPDAVRQLRVELAIAPNDRRPTEVVTSHASTYVQHANGEISAFGDNSANQLGYLGPNVERPRAIAGTGIVTAVSAGHDFACAASLDGKARCWGSDTSGQLGRGGFSNAVEPTPVIDVSDAVAVAAAAGHACALASNGRVRCWGSNSRGEAGSTAAGTDVTTPIEVLVGPASDLVAGDGFGCALTASHEVFCWGANDLGQLGSRNAGPNPVRVPIDDAVALAAGGAHACARIADGDVFCWGANGQGQLGAEVAAEGSPVRSSLSGAPGKLLASGALTCVVEEASSRCSGRSIVMSPHAPDELGGVISVSSSGGHACLVDGQHQVSCWGFGGLGQLGSQPTALRRSPVVVPGISGATGLEAKGGTTCVRRAAGPDVCFGRNRFAELTELSSPTLPVPTESGLRSVQLCLGTRHGCARTSSTSGIACWGANDLGQLGRPDGPALTEAVDSALARELGCGADTTCGVFADASVRCWGSNRYAQLGTGGSLDGFVEAPARILEGAKSVRVGTVHACALRTDGEIHCWGYNGGQLGVGRIGAEVRPKRALLDVPAVELESEIRHTCARTGDGRVFCFGPNDFGENGDGTTERRVAPVEVTGIDDATQLATGASHTCVLRRSGRVSCFGSNAFGQLGASGVTARSATPVDVEDLEDVRAITAGSDHSCALLEHGRVSCWGSDAYGQLGIGTQTYVDDPTPVPFD